MNIFEDNWKGYLSEDKEYKASNIDDIYQAIKRLNGQNKTIIELIKDDSCFLTVGGGNEGYYICYLTLQDRIFNLINKNYSEEKIEVVAGGQKGMYDAKLCNDISDILKAAEFFFQASRANPDQIWEENL